MCFLRVFQCMCNVVCGVCEDFNCRDCFNCENCCDFDNCLNCENFLSCENCFNRGNCFNRENCLNCGNRLNCGDQWCSACSDYCRSFPLCFCLERRQPNHQNRNQTTANQPRQNQTNVSRPALNDPSVREYGQQNMVNQYTEAVFNELAEVLQANEQDRGGRRQRDIMRHGINVNQNQSQSSPNNRRAICCICMDEAAIMMSEPCKHLCMCQGCSRGHRSAGDRRCPICRCRLRSIVQVYY